MSEADRRTWDERHRERGGSGLDNPSPSLVALDGLLPSRGRALDLAGGTGRNALWLARRGLDVTLVDISGVALEIARTRADADAIPLRTCAIDLETGPIPPGPWDLIVSIYYLWRPVFAAIPESLAPGGMLVVVHPTRTNLVRHAKPGARHLLDDGELPSLVPTLEILRSDEGWGDEGRHEARIVARRPSAG